MENKLNMENNKFTNDVQGGSAETIETVKNNEAEFSVDTLSASLSQTTNPMTSSFRSKGVGRKYNVEASSSSKKTPASGPKQKSKAPGRKYVSSKPVPQLFASKQARVEITKYEELKKKATSNLNAVYDEIRPAIVAHGLDSQHKVPTSIAGKWMDATCAKWKADINLSFSIIKNVAFPPNTDDNTEAKGSGGEGEDK